MAKKKKNGNHDTLGKVIIMVTTVLNLIRAFVELVNKLRE